MIKKCTLFDRLNTLSLLSMCDVSSFFSKHPAMTATRQWWWSTMLPFHFLECHEHNKFLPFSEKMTTSCVWEPLLSVGSIFWRCSFYHKQHHQDRKCWFQIAWQWKTHWRKSRLNALAAMMSRPFVQILKVPVSGFPNCARAMWGLPFSGGDAKAHGQLQFNSFKLVSHALLVCDLHLSSSQTSMLATMLFVEQESALTLPVHVATPLMPDASSQDRGARERLEEILDVSQPPCMDRQAINSQKLIFHTLSLGLVRMTIEPFLWNQRQKVNQCGHFFWSTANLWPFVIKSKCHPQVETGAMEKALNFCHGHKVTPDIKMAQIWRAKKISGNDWKQKRAHKKSLSLFCLCALLFANPLDFKNANHNLHQARKSWVNLKQPTIEKIILTIASIQQNKTLTISFSKII